MYNTPIHIFYILHTPIHIFDKSVWNWERERRCKEFDYNNLIFYRSQQPFPSLNQAEAELWARGGIFSGQQTGDFVRCDWLAREWSAPVLLSPQTTTVTSSQMFLAELEKYFWYSWELFPPPVQPDRPGPGGAAGGMFLYPAGAGAALRGGGNKAWRADISHSGKKLISCKWSPSNSFQNIHNTDWLRLAKTWSQSQSI